MASLSENRRTALTTALVACAGLCVLLGAATVMAQTHSGGSDGPNPTFENDGTSEVESSTITERIVYTFSGYHASTKPETLLGFGPRTDVVAALKEVASDAEMRPSIRLRAVDALGRIGGDEVTTYLESLLERPDPRAGDRHRRVSELLRMHAISGLGRALEDARAAERLESLWPEADIQTRLTIVEALGSQAGAAGRQVLGRLNEQVQEGVVKEKIDAHLSH